MDPVGWTNSEFKVIDNDSETDSDTILTQTPKKTIRGPRGYSAQKYKKILDEVELLPE